MFETTPQRRKKKKKKEKGIDYWWNNAPFPPNIHVYLGMSMSPYPFTYLSFKPGLQLGPSVSHFPFSFSSCPTMMKSSNILMEISISMSDLSRSISQLLQCVPTRRSFIFLLPSISRRFPRRELCSECTVPIRSSSVDSRQKRRLLALGLAVSQMV